GGWTRIVADADDDRIAVGCLDERRYRLRHYARGCAHHLRNVTGLVAGRDLDDVVAWLKARRDSDCPASLTYIARPRNDKLDTVEGHLDAIDANVVCDDSQHHDLFPVQLRVGRRVIYGDFRRVYVARRRGSLLRRCRYGCQRKIVSGFRLARTKSEPLAQRRWRVPFLARFDLVAARRELEGHR